MTPSARFKLNVVFHGLWAWEAQDDKIYAHTPIEPEHQIAVGDFLWQDPIKEGAKCVLDGVSPGSANQFNKDQNLSIDHKAFKNESLRHCVVVLPLPGDIKSVRRVTVAQPPASPPFSGKDGAALWPKQVTMVQVFIYDFADLKAITLSPQNLQLKINADGQTANLHFFAQPPGGSHTVGMNAVAAYQHMAQMFALDITPVAPLFTGPSDPGIPGLTADDTDLLGETTVMKMAKIRLIGESGSNCDGLVVDNRQNPVS